MICFGDIDRKVDYYLATSIPEEVMSNEEIGEADKQRWAIEVLWKFLKGTSKNRSQGRSPRLWFSMGWAFQRDNLQWVQINRGALKMHLKLDRMMSKSLNGITIQIYMIMIIYLILQLLEVPKIYGGKLLGKQRYSNPI